MSPAWRASEARSSGSAQLPTQPCLRRRRESPREGFSEAENPKSRQSGGHRGGGPGWSLKSAKRQKMRGPTDGRAATRPSRRSRCPGPRLVPLRQRHASFPGTRQVLGGLQGPRDRPGACPWVQSLPRKVTTTAAVPHCIRSPSSPVLRRTGCPEKQNCPPHPRGAPGSEKVTG